MAVTSAPCIYISPTTYVNCETRPICLAHNKICPLRHAATFKLLSPSLFPPPTVTVVTQHNRPQLHADEGRRSGIRPSERLCNATYPQSHRGSHFADPFPTPTPSPALCHLPSVWKDNTNPTRS